MTGNDAMPDEGVQGEFVFVDGWPGGESNSLPPTLDEEIAAIWHVPIGKRVHIDLRQHDLTGTTGRLEIARAPDWPFDPRQPLALRVGHVLFTDNMCLVLDESGRLVFDDDRDEIRAIRHPDYRPQHFLNFFPLPQGQGSLRPTF